MLHQPHRTNGRATCPHFAINPVHVTLATPLPDDEDGTERSRIWLVRPLASPISPSWEYEYLPFIDLLMPFVDLLSVLEGRGA